MICGVFKALSKIACNRLQKELVEWQVNPPAGFKHKVTDNLQRSSLFRSIIFLPPFGFWEKRGKRTKKKKTWSKFCIFLFTLLIAERSMEGKQKSTSILYLFGFLKGENYVKCVFYPQMVKTTWFKLFLVTEQMVKGILFLVHFLKINNVNFDLWEIGVWSSSYSSIYWELVLIKRWVIEVYGAPGTLYANESYQLQVDFPEHYPMEAPQVAKNIIKICISFFIYFFCML